MSTSRKLVLSVMVVALGVAVIGQGTFATFIAQVRSPGNGFAHGTLVLSGTKQGGSTCLSTGGGTTDTNVNGACDVLFNLTVKRPGDSGSANLTVKNEGSLATSLFKTFATACSNGDAAGETYHGTGSPCGKVQLSIQQWSNSNFTTPGACLYGGAVTANTCDFSDTTKTLGAFQSAYNSPTNGLSAGNLASGASGYFTVAVKSPSDTDNTYQGRQAAVDFNWYAE